MINSETIRSDLKDIRYYFSRKQVFDENASFVGDCTILAKIKKYNKAVCSAPPRLYDLYVSLYMKDSTQEALSYELGYTFETISRLNSQLIKHFQCCLEVA